MTYGGVSCLHSGGICVDRLEFLRSSAGYAANFYAGLNPPHNRTAYLHAFISFFLVLPLF